MNATPKFIYFDLDDTLLDHKQAEQQALGDIHRYYDLFSETDPDRLIAIYHDINREQWEMYGRAEVNRKQLQRNRFELTLRRLGLDESRFAEVGSQYMQYYKDHWQWVSGARDAFHTIRKNFDVGILTNGFAETQKKKFKQFDLYGQADHLVISEDVGVMKPHPDVFEYATDLAGCKPGEILYVGDSFTSDVTGGANFGWKVAWFTSNDHDDQKIKADFTFNHFPDLCAYIGV